MEFSCSFLNVKNVQSNYIYAVKVIKENMIYYFCETWLSELDKRFLDDLGTNCKYLNQSDFIIKTIGRPFGASCWFINNKVEIIKSEFINEKKIYELINKSINQ